MIYKIGLENNYEGRSLAWVLGHPGCFAYGTDGYDALHHLPHAIQDYIEWIALHNQQPWLSPPELPLEATEIWEVYTINEEFEISDEGYEVNAWFLDDWKPLTEQEIERALKLLAWSRADLLEVVRDLSPQALEVKRPNERWSIAGILGHAGGAEWWYLNRLGLGFPRQELHATPFERLEQVRGCLLETLPTLVGSRLVTGASGELWSPRKLLRRAAWHERDHTRHIQKLV
jgi:hypothetical protein